MILLVKQNLLYREDFLITNRLILTGWFSNYRDVIKLTSDTKSRILGTKEKINTKKKRRGTVMMTKSLNLAVILTATFATGLGTFG